MERLAPLTRIVGGVYIGKKKVPAHDDIYIYIILTKLLAIDAAGTSAEQALEEALFRRLGHVLSDE